MQLETDTFDSVRRFLVGRRHYRGLKQADIATSMGVSTSFVSRLETGRVKDPQFTTVVRWIEALGYEPHLNFYPQRGRP